MPYTEVEICNLALDKLGADPINTLDAPLKVNERRFARAYPHYRDLEMGSRRWKFAITFVQITPTGTPIPNVDYPYRYVLPAGTLRVIRRPGELWIKAGNEIHRPDQGTFDLKLIVRKPPGDFPAEFAEVLAGRLAMELCEAVTQSNAKKKTAAEMYADAMSRAAAADSFETASEDEEWGGDDNQFSWVTARWGWNG